MAHAAGIKPGQRQHQCPQHKGQSPAASAPKLSTEQRTKIVGIFHEHKIEPARLDTPGHLGVQIPQDVKQCPVPPDVVEIHPLSRGYNYIQVANEILIIDRGMRAIVEIFHISREATSS